MKPSMARPSVVTSIKVDEDLWKKAKKRAVDDEITLQELIGRRRYPRVKARRHGRGLTQLAGNQRYVITLAGKDGITQLGAGKGEQAEANPEATRGIDRGELAVNTGQVAARRSDALREPLVLAAPRLDEGDQLFEVVGPALLRKPSVSKTYMFSDYYIFIFM